MPLTAGEKIETGELELATDGRRRLPSGIYARWSR